LISETEGAAEVGGPGFFGDEGVGSGLDNAILDALGAENAAELGRGFEESVIDCAGAAGVFESEGGGESGDAAADDGNANHE
jgi:hypothetical protein